MSAFPRPMRPARRGAIIVLVCLLMAILVGLAAFAVDVGYLRVARCEAQRTADAAALAAAWEIIDAQGLQGDFTMSVAMANCRQEADQSAARNLVCTQPIELAPNPDNDLQGDVVVGTIDDFSDLSSPLYTDNPATYNAVQVRVRRHAGQNGEVPLFFGRIWGLRSAAVQAQATAGIVKDIKGFRVPEDGGNLLILPLTLRETTWNSLLAGQGDDSWAWNDTTKTVSSGSDSIPELNLFPEDTGASGNSGTLRIGRNNNGTGPLSQQIIAGLTAEDLNLQGGSLEMEGGEIQLSGDPGISATIRNALESIIGEPRLLPIYREVSNGGSNATFTIVKFVGVRIVDVKLTGGNKHVAIQPANVVIKGVIADTAGSGSSQFIYSIPYLIR